MQIGNENLSALSESIADAVQRASRMVVAVNSNQRIASSGVSWGNGVIATADHTLRRDDDLTVVLPDNRTVGARLVGRDPGTDLAVLQLETSDLAAAVFAEPSSLRRERTQRELRRYQCSRRTLAHLAEWTDRALRSR